MEITNGFFKQLLTISVASLGFFYALEQTGNGAGVGSMHIKLSILGFFACILFGLLGQISIMAGVYRDKSVLPKAMQNPRLWIPFTWGGFAIGFAGFVSMTMVR